jgi:hypothetical protein
MLSNVPSSTHTRHAVPLLGIAALAAGTVLSLLFVPNDAWTGLGVPETHALYGYLTILPVLAIVRRTGRARAERVVAALFLVSMALVYLAAALRAHQPLGLELAGLALFGGLALAGSLRSPWWLVAGIAAHGLAWDLWHTDGVVVQAWYAPACAVIDVALASYLATRVATLSAPR